MRTNLIHIVIAVEYRMLMCSYNRLCTRSVTASTAKVTEHDWGQTGMSPLRYELVGIAAAGGIEIAVVEAAYTIGRAHRAICRAQGAHAGKERLDFTRRPTEVAAIGAGRRVH